MLGNSSPWGVSLAADGSLPSAFKRSVKLCAIKLGMEASRVAPPRALLRGSASRLRPRPRPRPRPLGRFEFSSRSGAVGCVLSSAVATIAGAKSVGAAAVSMASGNACASAGCSAVDFFDLPARLRLAGFFSAFSSDRVSGSAVLPDIACSIRGISIFTSPSMAAKFFSSRGLQIIMAVPDLPARPVRPIRCT